MGTNEFRVKSLEQFREGLLAIPKDQLNHDSIYGYAVKNRGLVDVAGCG